MNNKKYISFDDFINPHFDIFSFEYLFLDELKSCSYVRYLFIPVINGEINGVPFIVCFEDLVSFKKIYYSDEFCVFAIQYLDNYVVEVVDFLNNFS